MRSTACHRHEVALSRREAIVRCGSGLGAAALGMLMERDGALAAGTQGGSASGTSRLSANPLAAREPHFPATARCVISLFMQGGPSQMDTFDPKPELQKLDGQPLPASFKSEDLKLQFMSAAGAALMGSPFAFKKRGESGLEISDLFPRLADHADELAVIRSCYHESFIHGPALSLVHSGNLLLGHPSVGSWVVSGLGCESDNLPAFVVMTDGRDSRQQQRLQFGLLAGRVPGHADPHRGRGHPESHSAAANHPCPAAHVDRPTGPLERAAPRRPRGRHEPGSADRELRIGVSYASGRAEVIDLAQESAATRELYGVDREPTARFGRMCLLARRMVERGVRFVELYSNDWDGHGDCRGNHRDNAGKTDQPIAALLTDLKQRGMLDSTLVLWVGEFGRTPVMQGNKGRDHNPYGFSAWLAGGGVHGGRAIGATDELGFRAVDDKVHVHDLHATMLTLLGLDHEKLTYLFEGPPPSPDRRWRSEQSGGAADGWVIGPARVSRAAAGRRARFDSLRPGHWSC